MPSKFLIVDTDQGFVQRFKRRILEEDVADKYIVAEIVPDTTLDERELIEKCLTELGELLSGTLPVAAIFVDIVILERGETDIIGIKLARRIRGLWPNIPLFNVTGKIRHEQDQEIFSEATLEDIDGVLAKVYLDGKHASAMRFRNLAEIATSKRSPKVSDSVNEGTARYRPNSNIEESFGRDKLDPFVASVIEDLGPQRFWTLMGLLLPDGDGLLSVMVPGRSGAAVIKAVAKFRSKGRSATRPTHWVIKMASSLDLLTREIAGYAEVKKTPLARRSYPRLLHEEVKTVDGLGGIVVELESNSATLLDVLTQPVSVKKIDKILSELKIALSSLYGDQALTFKKLWRDCYLIDSSASLRIRGFLEEQRNIIKALKLDLQARRLETFLLTQGGSENWVANIATEVDFRNLHGDLNTRNILVTDAGAVVLIDFASRRQGHIASDLAKLERDLIFRAIDAGSPEFHSWDRLATWQTLIGSYGPDVKDFFDLRDWAGNLDSSLYLTAVTIAGTRKLIKGLSPSTTAGQYTTAILHYSILALLHPDLSLHKKMFGIWFIDKLMSSGQHLAKGERVNKRARTVRRR